MPAAALYYPAGGRTAPTTSSFTLNPSPREGQGPYGAVPGPLGMPSPYADLASLYPNLSAQTGQISKNIMGELKGELSPETVRSIQDAAATFGVSSGMPGSELAGFRGLRDLGMTTEKLQGQGLQDYLNAITGISKTQTVSPELQTEIASQNAVWGAAPDPAAAAEEQQKLFEEYMQELRGPAGGTEEPSASHERRMPFVGGVPTGQWQTVY